MARGAGRGGAVRGPASALTSFLAGLGVEPPRRLTTWGNTADLGPDEDQPQAEGSGTTDIGNVLPTEANTMAGPTEVGEGTPQWDDESVTPSVSSSVKGKGKPKGINGKGKRKANSEELDSDALDSPEPSSKKTKKPTPKDKGKSKQDEPDSDDLDGDEAFARNTTYQQSNIMKKAVAGSTVLKGIGHKMKCGECEKDFTVTKYTKQHPNTDPPSWLCHECCLALGIDAYAKAKPVKKPAAKSKKDDRGKITHYEARKGVKELADLCIGIIGKHIEDVDQFGDIGANNLDKVCKIISKSRRLTSETAILFYSIGRTDLAMYDCTLLDPSAFITISNLCPNLTHLRLDLCGQLNSEAVRTWGQNLKSLQRLELNAPFLVRKDGWLDFFPAVGSRLKGFLLTQSPRFNLECLESMVKHCPDLTELRLSQIGDMGDTFIGEISKLKHLSLLDISDPSAQSITDGPATDLLQSVGSNLRTLNLGAHVDLSDDFPKLIAEHCPRLANLYLRCLDFSDEAVAALFTTMKELKRPGLLTIDLEKGNFCKGSALRALVAHSGVTVEKLNLMGWKDLEEEAMQTELVKCHKLTTLDIGWCRNVTDYVVKDVLDQCDAIEKVNVWGCSQLTDAIPRKKGVKVIGIETHAI